MSLQKAVDIKRHLLLRVKFNRWHTYSLTAYPLLLVLFLRNTRVFGGWAVWLRLFLRCRLSILLLLVEAVEMHDTIASPWSLHWVGLDLLQVQDGLGNLNQVLLLVSSRLCVHVKTFQVELVLGWGTQVFRLEELVAGRRAKRAHLRASTVSRDFLGEAQRREGRGLSSHGNEIAV